MNDQKTVRASFTRPNDATQYDAGDCVCNSDIAPELMTFSLGAGAGSRGYITNAKMAKNSPVVTASLFRLYLYNKALAPVNDNVAFALLFADVDALLGFIDFDLTSEGGSSDCAVDVITNINMKFANEADPEKKIYGVLVAKDTYTPVENEQFMVELTAERWS